jgi:hypothetical protein
VIVVGEGGGSFPLELLLLLLLLSLMLMDANDIFKTKCDFYFMRIWNCDFRMNK